MSDASARRKVLPAPSKAHHAGLILTRYLKHPVQRGAEADKRELLDDAKRALKDKALKEIYKLAYDRWLGSLPTDARVRKFKAESPLIVGLGGENVTDVGITLHHTYGVPYLPGSALKGVTSHYAFQVWGAKDPSWCPDTQPLDQPNHYRTLFGTSNEGGMVDFLDGWITDTSLKNCLADDVMTPHHGDYYMASLEDVREPTDFDNPIPVSFLTVRGAFHMAVCKRDPRLPDIWLDTAMQLLVLSLSEFGIGGKTNAGYGRLVAEHEQLPIEQPSQTAVVREVKLEIVDPNGDMEVMNLDGSLLGTITNVDEVPSDLRQAGQRVIGQVITEDDPNACKFRFLRAALDSPP